MHSFLFILTTVLLVPLSALNAAEPATSTTHDASPAIQIRRFQPDQPIFRAQRPAPVTATIINTGDSDATITASLILPKGLHLLKAAPDTVIRLAGRDSEHSCTWQLQADEAGASEVQLCLTIDGKTIASQTLALTFLPAMEMHNELSYIPEPKPVQTDMLIGAHACPLWESDKPDMWRNVLKHPERMPALGLYSQENPEVSDWETKWAVEHGISFFVYCWYRISQGGAVKTKFGSAIHDGLFKSRFADKMKFTLMWENQARGSAGVSDEKDLMENLLPYWIENYFSHPSYLKVDNKPVLFIYRPEFLIQDLGSVANVLKAFGKMREACKANGFDGLHLLGEYRGTDPKHLQLMKELGLDYTFAYCWGVPNNPTPEQSIQGQMAAIRKTQELNVLPQVVTVSQAWSGWRDEGSIWKIPPVDFERLLRQAKEFTTTLPKHELGSRMLLLDNWNEWGEGHYIAPYREYGFGYLDAVRRVFSNASEAHDDLIPEDIGMGPYDTAIRGFFDREERQQKRMSRKVTKPGAAEGLLGWWTFDEDEADGSVAFDHSGHRLGGAVHDMTRTAGFEGSAMVCDGGSVVVPANPQLSFTQALSIECRVKTDQAGQRDKWIANRIFGNKPAGGFRFGLSGGKPCIHIPLTAWSHSLTASEPLPTGRWVHLAATFDGKTMRIYIDGVERGTMERAGAIGPTDAHLVLGNFEVDHAAHFTGLLDDVRLYHRALSPEEIRGHAAENHASKSK